MTADRRAAHGLATALAAFTLWAVAFTALYVVQALGCRYAWSPLLHQAMLFGVWLVPSVALALMLGFAWTARRGRMARVGLAATAAALVSTLWTGLPLLLASTCV
ncbi:hypothetical protein STVA_46860 [Allostella vacuolata]|nr:hypothetical protein STVA_46860 [Stella vacuolata]